MSGVGLAKTIVSMRSAGFGTLAKKLSSSKPNKVLRFFADRAAKKWPLRGSLKLE